MSGGWLWVVLAGCGTGGVERARGVACTGAERLDPACEGEASVVLRPGAPLAPASAQRLGNSVGHGEQRALGLSATERRGFGPPPGFGPGGAPGPGDPPAVPSCTSTDLDGLSGEPLVTYLTTQTSSCLSFLWIPDASVQASLVDANLRFVADRVLALAPTYDGTNAQGMRQLLMYLRVAYYHAWYGALTEPDAITDAGVEAAVLAMADSPHVLDDGAEAGDVLYELINVADAADLTPWVLDLYDAALATLAHPDRIDEYSQLSALYSTLVSIARQATHPDLLDDPAQVDALLATLAVLAQDGNGDLLPDDEWVVDNAIWALGNLAKVTDLHTDAVDALVAAQDAHERLSLPYLWTVKVLDDYADCETSDPAVALCMADVVPEIEAVLFPYSYALDDGAFVVRTPLSLGELQGLYHASREVQAQFSRVTQTIAPLEGDPNGVLTVKLYDSPAAYRSYQGLLYGLSTSNGGIYIEQEGVFYTYDRLPSESLYTLEELFRHEYVHYLVGRFLIEGDWGELPIYDDDRMVWFDEGMAEFLAGSTARDGVAPRQTLVGQVADDPERMTAAQVMASTYGDFDFYRYAGLLMHHLYTDDIGTLRRLVRRVRTGDGARVDALTASMAADPALEAAYQAHLDDLVASVDTLTDPVAVFPDPAVVTSGSTSDLELAFRDTRVGFLAECSVAVTGLDPRFSCQGTLSGPIGPQPLDPDEAWHGFDAALDELLDELISDGAYDNFEHVTCRMGPTDTVEVGPDAYGVADYYCDGPLASGTYALLRPHRQMRLDLRSTRLGTSATCAHVAGMPVVDCDVPLATALYPASTPLGELEAELDFTIDRLRDQLYAVRPAYYRDLSCASQGNEQLVTSGADVYLAATALCTADFTGQ